MEIRGIISMTYYVYILQCKDGSLYTGSTNDYKRRFLEHKEGEGAKYTRAKGVQKIVHVEEFATRNEALKRESNIKSLTREKKLALIDKMI